MVISDRVVFDTDIGTDVDDILALAFLLGSPEIQIDGITTVYGDVDLRARMVLKTLQLRDREDVPVHIGVSEPLLGRDPVFWPGHEGVGLLQDDDQLAAPSRTHAVDFLIRHVLENPREITLLAVGPLTNVAIAIIREPKVAGALKRLVIMGGRITMRDNTGLPGEHNMRCDPDAAHVVFDSGAPIELIPLDVTLRTLIRQEDVENLQNRGTPYHDAIAGQIIRYPGFIARGGTTFLHDPLAAMAVLKPDLLSWIPYNVQIELTGTLTRGMMVARVPDDENPPTASVAMNVDAGSSERFITRCLAE